MNEPAPHGVDATWVSGIEHEERVATLLGGGLLSERIRHGHGHEPFSSVPPAFERPSADLEVSLGPATRIEVEDGEVCFLAPFSGEWPSDYWLRAFRQAQLLWPSQLMEPRIDEGRGLQFGPLPAAQLEQHVRAAQEQVAAANRIYFDEIEPELRRQHEEAIRREHEEHRLQAEVEAKLKYLLG